MQDIEMRYVGLEGVNYIYWPQSDSGAFGKVEYDTPVSGPIGDWYNCKHEFMKHVKKFDVVIQAGGNCGMYPLFYSKYFKKVYTFEPDDLNFYCLDLNCVGDQFHKYKVGLGEASKNVSLKLGPSYNIGEHKIDETPGNIPIITIDSLNLTSCDLIHLDIEGYEPKALLGARNTIEKFRPVIITERSSGEDIILAYGYEIYKVLNMDTVYIPK